MRASERNGFILFSLVEAFEKLGVEVRFEDLSFEDVKGKGGKCRVRGKDMVIIDKGLEAGEKISILVEQLNRLDCDGIYLPPNVREMMERRGGEDG